MSSDFEDEDTLEFVRFDDAGDDELALESAESWFWNDRDDGGLAANG
jgi:hypothetical protein